MTSDSLAKKATGELLQATYREYGGVSLCVGGASFVVRSKVDLDAIGKRFNEVIAAAIEDGRHASPLPSPVSDVELSDIRAGVDDMWREPAGMKVDPSRKFMIHRWLRSLLRHLDYLQHIMADDLPAAAVREAYRLGRERGFVEGAAEQKAACVLAARGAAGGSTIGRNVGLAVADVPILFATPDAKQPGET